MLDRMHCKESLPALNLLDYWSGRQRTLLWDRDRLVYDHPWVPGFPSCSFWMFPEQIRNKSELVVSEEIHRAPKIRDSGRLNSLESFQ